MDNNPIFRPVLTDKQSKAWKRLWDDTITDVMYGGAKGGGKSHFLCVWVLVQALWIAEQNKISRTDNPIHVGWFGRKQATDFTGTTLATWRRVIPSQYYQIKSGTEKDTKHILIDGRVAVDFGGLDRQENINKFNSAEYAFIAIDQAEEVTRDEVSVLRASRRLTINGKQILPKGLFTANPANCWLKDEFITAPKKNMCFVQALPTDNPYLPTDYKQTIYDAFGHRPELIRAYWEGDWSAYEGANQVIKAMWLDAAANRLSIHDTLREYLVCDPARFGDDETVIMRFEDTEIAEKIVMPYCRTTEISNRLATESIRHGDIPIVVESTGGDVGSGVVDELVQLGRHVIVFNPSSKAEQAVYYNCRAEAWWEASKMLACGVADDNHNILVTTKNLDFTTREQLFQPTYFYRNGRLLIEDKTEIKKRLGRSPDHADCYIIGLWAYKRIPLKSLLRKNSHDDGYERRKNRTSNNPMVCV